MPGNLDRLDRPMETDTQLSLPLQLYPILPLPPHAPQFVHDAPAVPPATYQHGSHPSSISSSALTALPTLSSSAAAIIIGTNTTSTSASASSAREAATTAAGHPRRQDMDVERRERERVAPRVTGAIAKRTESGSWNRSFVTRSAAREMRTGCRFLLSWAL